MRTVHEVRALLVATPKLEDVLLALDALVPPDDVEAAPPDPSPKFSVGICGCWWRTPTARELAEWRRERRRNR